MSSQKITGLEQPSIVSDSQIRRIFMHSGYDTLYQEDRQFFLDITDDINLLNLQYFSVHKTDCRVVRNI